MKLLKNVSASVKQRLLNRSSNDSRSFNVLLQYLVMESFLYRLSVYNAVKLLIQYSIDFKIPNKETRAAMAELESGKGYPSIQ